MKLTFAVTLMLGVVGAFFATAASADESAARVVKVDSLAVKERIRSMEQINVSAETDKLPEQPSSSAVADLLLEAGELDKQTDNAQR